MSIELRPITEDEFSEFHLVEGTVFGEVDQSQAALDYERAVVEFDRTIAGFDRGRIVSSAGAYSFEMTIPGGAFMPVAGVTAVGVLPTHRRRGILSKMMAHQLGDIAARGEAIAILNASEAGIYRRFGYGLAQFSQSWKFDTIRCGFNEPVRPDLELQVVPQEKAADFVRPIYEAWRTTRAGALSQTDGWWDCVFGDFKSWRGGGKVFTVACPPNPVAGHGGGFAIYTINAKAPPGLWRLNVRDFVACNSEVSAALWRYLLDVDLVGTVVAPVVPMDDPLRWRLADARQVQTTGVRDFLWVRILDVESALSARRYNSSDSISFGLHDRLRSEVSGRYHLLSGPDGAVCERLGDRAPVELEMGVAELGSLYLGGVHIADLAAGGGVVEMTPGALVRADAMFTWPVAPFCITRF